MSGYVSNDLLFDTARAGVSGDTAKLQYFEDQLVNELWRLENRHQERHLSLYDGHQNN
jgi:hypothetical protein